MISAASEQPASGNTDRLASLGFESYDDYLKSDLWNDIRRRVLRRVDHFCECCSVQASQVHHFRYDLDVLTGRNIEPLAAVCGRCHTLAHLTASGQKRTLGEANRLLFADMLRKDCDNAVRIARTMGYRMPAEEPLRIEFKAPEHDPAEFRNHPGYRAPKRRKRAKAGTQPVSKSARKRDASLIKREIHKQANRDRTRRLLCGR